MTNRKASCTCGQLHALVSQEPLRVSICHCLACQTRTGSVFGVQATFPLTAVSINGEKRSYLRIGDEGSKIHFHFCPVCGATVYYQIDNEPLLVIPVGAFADPTFPQPSVSIYEERMHHWIGLPDGIQHID